VAKIALLIGVGEYGLGLNPLPGAVKDVEAMQRVLLHPEMGQFDQVKTLTNPDLLTMQRGIENLFADREKDDLVLLFFSGHGVKDDYSKLYFATTITAKRPNGELEKSTAVPANFVHDVMRNSRSKRQVILLDCCFSGAFAEDMRAKGDGSVDVQTQLGGEGRAVLTSSTSTQYSFEQQGSDLSVYTRFLVEGMETGAADSDGDGVISIDELHEYASRKVQESAPAMKPKIYAVEEGFKIRLAKAPIGDPKLSYRKEVERFASRGEISDIVRYTLDARQAQLGISSAVAQDIEAQVLKPYQEYQQKLQKYEEVLVKALERESSLSDYTRQELNRFQEVLGLEDKDLESIKSRLILPPEEVQSQPLSCPQPSNTASPPVQAQYRQQRVGGLDLNQSAAKTPTDPSSSLSQTSSPQSKNTTQPLKASSEALSKPPRILSSKAARRSVLLGSIALGLVVLSVNSLTIGHIFWGFLIIILGSMCVWIWGREQGIAPWRNHGILRILFWGSQLLLGFFFVTVVRAWGSYPGPASMYFNYCIIATLVHLTTTFIGRW
jgi:hypothetical protein